jgi:hypothetical protein
MNYQPVPHRPVGRFASGLLFLPVLLCAADQSAPPAAGEAKTHVVFMGADLSVQQEKKFYRVEDVVGSEFMIRVNRQEVFVPTRQRTTGLRVDHELKITSASVTLDGLESGPGYTPANDPRLKFDRASGAAAGGKAVQDLAYGRLFRYHMDGSVAPPLNPLANDGTRAAINRNTGGSVDGGGGPIGGPTDLDVLMGEMDVANQVMMQDQYIVGTHADTMQKELAEGNYDAMEASFKISSSVELIDPYMVLLFKFLERDATPGNEGMLIYARALDPIDEKPRYIRVREGGMPRGFKFIDCQVHIYNRGKEVATNVSPNRVELSRDEARQYILIEHIGANRRTTVPATTAPGGLRAGTREQLAPAQLSRVCYVKVSKEGTLLGAYADEACNLQLGDPAVESVLADVFYKPALHQGKPVEGVARVSLADLSL